jgi:hypothetical protein
MRVQLAPPELAIASTIGGSSIQRGRSANAAGLVQLDSRSHAGDTGRIISDLAEF